MATDETASLAQRDAPSTTFRSFGELWWTNDPNDKREDHTELGMLEVTPGAREKKDPPEQEGFDLVLP